jgi:hypothetical protein
MEPMPPEDGERSAHPEEPRERAALPRSRFEDLSDLEVPVARPTRVGRPAIVTTAAVVLSVSALMNAIVVIGFRPEGTSLWISAGLAVGQALGALLVVLLVPVGRPYGIAIGVVGVVLGLVVATDGSAGSGLVTMGLNGFVIYALAASGPSFRRG